MLGNMKITDFLRFTASKVNPIKELRLRADAVKEHVSTILDLCQGGFETNSHLINEVKGMIPEEIRLNIGNRAQHEKDDTIMRIGESYIAIHMNLFRAPRSIKHRELFFHSGETEHSEESLQFSHARKILHPRERMTHYMDLQSKTYTNEKLHRLGMITSNKCLTCPDQIETRDHLYVECPRAKSAWKVYEETLGEKINDNEIKSGPQCNRALNVFSLVKHQILCFRDKEINLGLLRVKCENRLNDVRLAQFNRKNHLDKQNAIKILLGKEKTLIKTG
jgi:hypothetical protein